MIYKSESNIVQYKEVKRKQRYMKVTINIRNERYINVIFVLLKV